MIDPSTTRLEALARAVVPLLCLGAFAWVLHASGRQEHGMAAVAAGLEGTAAHDFDIRLREAKAEHDYEAAAELAERLYEAFPSHVTAHTLANLYSKLGDLHAEVRAWERYMASSPTPAEACPAIGDALRALGDWEAAVPAYERCVRLKPFNTDLLFALGFAYERTSRRERAAVAYRRGLAISPRHSDIQLGMARVQLRLGDVDQAESLVADVRSRSPDNVDGLLVQGLVDMRRGDLVSAKHHLRRGVEIKATYADFYELLGTVAEREGDLDGAIAYYDQFLHLRPDTDRIVERLDDLRRTGQ